MSSGDSAPVHTHGRASLRAFVRAPPVHPASMCIVAMPIRSKVVCKPNTPITTSKSLYSPLLVGDFLPPFSFRGCNAAQTMPHWSTNNAYGCKTISITFAGVPQDNCGWSATLDLDYICQRCLPAAPCQQRRDLRTILCDTNMIPCLARGSKPSVPLQQ